MKFFIFGTTLLMCIMQISLFNASYAAAPAPENNTTLSSPQPTIQTPVTAESTPTPVAPLTTQTQTAQKDNPAPNTAPVTSPTQQVSTITETEPSTEQVPLNSNKDSSEQNKDSKSESNADTVANAGLALTAMGAIATVAGTGIMAKQMYDSEKEKRAKKAASVSTPPEAPKAVTETSSKQTPSLDNTPAKTTVNPSDPKNHNVKSAALPAPLTSTTPSEKSSAPAVTTAAEAKTTSTVNATTQKTTAKTKKTRRKKILSKFKKAPKKLVKKIVQTNTTQKLLLKGNESKLKREQNKPLAHQNPEKIKKLTNNVIKHQQNIDAKKAAKQERKAVKQQQKIQQKTAQGGMLVRPQGIH